MEQERVQWCKGIQSVICYYVAENNVKRGIAVVSEVDFTYILALTRVFSQFGLICAHKEFSLEQLNSDDTEHEDKQEGDQKDVTNGLDSNDDTLDHVFEAFGSINGTKRT